MCDPDEDDGIVIVAVNPPVEFVVTVLGVVASVVLSYFIVIVEDVVNELPDTVTVLATAPVTGFKEID